MSGLGKSVSLASQVFPVSLGGVTLALFAFAIDPLLVLPALFPVALHLWSGYQYGADHGCNTWTWRSRVHAVLAALGGLAACMVIYAKAESLTGFAWIYGIGILLWTIAAWTVGAMALVDDWN